MQNTITHAAQFFNTQVLIKVDSFQQPHQTWACS